MRIVQEDLIYDIGMNNGDDTACYLRQGGYRVLAVEADPGLVEQAERRFHAEIHQGRLTILNVGIAGEAGEATFWICDEVSVWNSFDRKIASRDNRPHHPIQIKTLPFEEILDTWGIPHYLKIDIEGNDLLCVKALHDPLSRYLSLEAECEGDQENSSDDELLRTLNLLKDVGYRRFKLINQRGFGSVRPLKPGKAFFRTLSAMESASDLLDRVVVSAAYGKLRAPGITPIARLFQPFPLGSSGPWGEATPGPWMDFDQARGAFLRRREKHFSGKNKAAYSFWYDWHATF